MLGQMFSTVAALSLTMFGPASAKPFNNPPVAVDDTLSAHCNTVALVVNVLANDSDPDNDTLTVTGATAFVGNVTAYPGYIEYEAFDNGTDTVVYTISDGHGGTDTGVVHVTISGCRD